MRLIDADELKKLFKHNLNDSLKETIIANILGKIIDNAPTVDQWHYPREIYLKRGIFISLQFLLPREVGLSLL